MSEHPKRTHRKRGYTNDLYNDFDIDEDDDDDMDDRRRAPSERQWARRLADGWNMLNAPYTRSRSIRHYEQGEDD